MSKFAAVNRCCCRQRAEDEHRVVAALPALQVVHAGQGPRARLPGGRGAPALASLGGAEVRVVCQRRSDSLLEGQPIVSAAGNGQSEGEAHQEERDLVDQRCCESIQAAPESLQRWSRDGRGGTLETAGILAAIHAVSSGVCRSRTSKELRRRRARQTTVR